jgi:repressor LexA
VTSLTPRQAKALLFIRHLVASRGYPPTVRELGDHVGLSSSSSVHFMLKRLEAKGYLKRDPGKPRTIEVLG